MQMHIEFKTDGDAFTDGNGAAEVARILRDIIDKVETTQHGSGPIHDLNGNRIGHWSLALSEG
ncbi:hypothetical protein [Mesorhizobium sp. M0767]|uniref:hypothetical protein n=1 Tax=Mesorhizobium sp. M0767 TaxID=2956995 RepID=UPI003338ADFC